jgi:hypothetical protein
MTSGMHGQLDHRQLDVAAVVAQLAAQRLGEAWIARAVARPTPALAPVTATWSAPRSVMVGSIVLPGRRQT